MGLFLCLPFTVTCFKLVILIHPLIILLVFLVSLDSEYYRLMFFCRFDTTVIFKYEGLQLRSLGLTF